MNPILIHVTPPEIAKTTHSFQDKYFFLLTASFEMKSCEVKTQKSKKKDKTYKNVKNKNKKSKHTDIDVYRHILICVKGALWHRLTIS